MTTDLHKDHEAWLDELTLELRLKDVGGRDIGDAVASAREFLVDARVPAREAFGTPRAYADELGLAPPPDRGAAMARTVVFAAVDVIGFLALAFAGGAAWRGERYDVDAGVVALTLGVVVLVLLTPRLVPVVLRAAPWKIGLGAAVLFGAQVATVAALGGFVLFTIWAWPVAAAGLAVLVASLVRAWVASVDAHDPVVEPLTGDEVGRPHRLLLVLPQLVSFVAAWGFVLLDVLVS